MVRFTLIDRGNRKGSVSIRLPFSTSIGDAFSWAFDVAEKLLALSNAVLPQITITYEMRDASPALAPVGTDLSEKVAFYYRNGDMYEATVLPSPKEELFSTEQPYAGIRVDESASAMGPWTDPTSTVLVLQTTLEGEPWPTTYIVGGKLL